MISKKVTVLAAVMLLAVAPVALAQDVCEGNFDCDGDVDGTDAAVFKADFGRHEYNNLCPGCPPPAIAPKTGQTTSYATGDDGDLEKGTEWPNPRFTDNLDGTATDHLTGLIWLKDANCFGQRTWNNALSDSNSLADGSCGLTDGSNAGDWRLPNHKELFSLIDAQNYSPALPSGHPFTNVQSIYYWSSTTYAYDTLYAWGVRIDFGNVHLTAKGSDYYVWPVRDEQ